MSISHRCVVDAKLEEIFDGRLSKYGIVEKFGAEEFSGTSRCLTDGGSVELWISSWGDDQSQYICGYESTRVIEVNLHRDFESTVYAEGEPRFYGFDTEYEFRRWNEKDGNESDNQFYSDLLNFFKLKRSNLRRDNTDMERMLVAHELIVKDPSLLSDSRKGELLSLIDEVSIEREKAQEKKRGDQFGDSIPF